MHNAIETFCDDELGDETLDERVGGKMFSLVCQCTTWLEKSGNRQGRS